MSVDRVRRYGRAGGCASLSIPVSAIRMSGIVLLRLPPERLKKGGGNAGLKGSTCAKHPRRPPRRARGRAAARGGAIPPNRR